MSPLVLFHLLRFKWALSLGYVRLADEHAEAAYLAALKSSVSSVVSE